MQEPEMADLVLQHPYSETLRPSVERLYKVLPEIEKLFGMMARQVRDDNNPVREERVING
jgi:hypothetical protein